MKDRDNQHLTAEQMNELVIADVNDPAAWGGPIVVGPSKGPRRWLHPFDSSSVSWGPGGIDSMTTHEVVSSDFEVQGGTPVFSGTRVPVKNLFDYLAAGDSLDEFLDDFPSVTGEQAVRTLEIAKEALLTLCVTRSVG